LTTKTTLLASLNFSNTDMTMTESRSWQCIHVGQEQTCTLQVYEQPSNTKDGQKHFKFLKLN